MAEEEKQEPQQAPDPMAAINEKLKPFGVTAQMVIPVIQPLIVDAVKVVLAEMKLPQVLEGAVDHKVSERLDSLIKQLQAQGAPATAAPAPGNGQGGAPAKLGQGGLLGNLDIGSLIQIGQMLGLGKKDDNPLAQISSFAQAMGGVMKNMLEPVMEIYNMGQANALKQVQVKDKLSDGK